VCSSDLPALTAMPRIYEFLAQFRGDMAAEALATEIEADLRGAKATLEVRRAEVPLEAGAIRDALLAAAANRPDFTGLR